MNIKEAAVMPELFSNTAVAIVTIVVALVVTFLFFLLMRFIVCWYFKINRIVTLLSSIDEKLNRLGIERDVPPVYVAPAEIPATQSETSSIAG
jgi:hypothetical protein